MFSYKKAYMNRQIIKNIPTYIYIAWLLTFISYFLMNKSDITNADISDITLVVSWSTVNLDVPENISFWNYSGSSININATKTLSWESETFYIDDQKWSDLGYYTTIEISDFVWVNYSWVIPAANATISISSGYMTTYTWANNDDIFVNTYTGASLDSPLTFIERVAWPNFSRIGKYYPSPNNISISLLVPAHQVIDDYASTFTITLYDEINP